MKFNTNQGKYASAEQESGACAEESNAEKNNKKKNNTV